MKRQNPDRLVGCGHWRPKYLRFSAGGVPGRIRSRLPGCIQRTCPAWIFQSSAKPHPLERHPAPEKTRGLRRFRTSDLRSGDPPASCAPRYGRPLSVAFGKTARRRSRRRSRFPHCRAFSSTRPAHTFFALPSHTTPTMRTGAPLPGGPACRRTSASARAVERATTTTYPSSAARDSAISCASRERQNGSSRIFFTRTYYRSWAGDTRSHRQAHDAGGSPERRSLVRNRRRPRVF